MENRTAWIDNAKGIAIICVILGHFGINNVLTSIIYTFHMPLFFVISGFFLNKNIENTSPRDFINKKIKRLLVPYFFFSVLLLLFYRIISILPGFHEIYGNIDYISSFFNIFIELKRGYLVRCHLWFLTSLFTSNLIIWLVCKYCNVFRQRLIITVLFLSALLYSELIHHTTIWFLDVSIVSCVFVYIGTKSLNRSNGFTMPMSVYYILVPAYLLASFLNYKNMGDVSVDMYCARYGNFFLFLISSLSGLILVIQLSKKLKSRYLTIIGRNSLIIYCIHFIPLYIFLYYIDKLIPINCILIPVIKLFCCFITIVLVLIVKPYISKYIPWAIGESSHTSVN